MGEQKNKGIVCENWLWEKIVIEYEYKEIAIEGKAGEIVNVLKESSL